MKLPLSLALLGGLAVALPALAQPSPGNGPGAGPGPGAGRERMFEQLDANRDGRITREEGMAWLQTRFAQVDADRDGAVSLAEAEAMARNLGGVGPRADAPRAAEREARWGERRAAMFRSLDANSDGRVTLEEVRPFAEARFRAADANGDGAVTREELPQHRGGQQQRGQGQPGGPPAQR